MRALGIEAPPESTRSYRPAGRLRFTLTSGGCWQRARGGRRQAARGERLADQRVRGGLDDLDADARPARLAARPRRRGPRGGTGRGPGAARAAPARPLDQHLRGLAHPRPVGGERERALEVLELLEPRLRDAPAGTGSGSSAAAVPGRGEYLNAKLSTKPDVAHERERGLEVGVGLAGEADDQVGRERDVRARRAQARRRARRYVVAAGSGGACARARASEPLCDRQVDVRAELRRARRGRGSARRRRRSGAGSCSGCARCPGSRRAGAMQLREGHHVRSRRAAPRASWRP